MNGLWAGLIEKAQRHLGGGLLCFKLWSPPGIGEKLNGSMELSHQEVGMEVVNGFFHQMELAMGPGVLLIVFVSRLQLSISQKHGFCMEVAITLIWWWFLQSPKSFAASKDDIILMFWSAMVTYRPLTLHVTSVDFCQCPPTAWLTTPRLFWKYLIERWWFICLFFPSNGSNFARPHQRLVDGKRRPWEGGRQASLRRCRWFF